MAQTTLYNSSFVEASERVTTMGKTSLRGNGGNILEGADNKRNNVYVQLFTDRKPDLRTVMSNQRPASYFHSK